MGGDPYTPNSLVAFGDSVTAGGNASDAAHRWPNIVAPAMLKTLINSGIGGTILQNTTQNSVTTIGGAAANNGRDTYVSRILQYEPSHVCILYGLNDIRLNDAAITAANFETDLGEIVDGLITGGVSAENIVIGSPPYCSNYTYYGAPFNGGSTEKHEAYVAKCAAVATAKSTKYIDVYQAMLDNGGASLLDVDGTHPNDAGHAVIANAFLSVM